MVVLRPPGRERRHVQELLLDGNDLKVTLHRRPRQAAPREVAGAVVLEPGASLLWFTFPGRPWEVAAFHDGTGRLLGHYTNLIRPPEIDDDVWRITDLFLDLWQPRDGEARLLDRGELDEARRRRWIDGAEADRVAELGRRLLERARHGSWPPDQVRRWTLEAVPALRLRRDEPGAYYANLVTGRVIAFGIYFLGAASVTSLAFAGLTDALRAPGPAQRAWVITLALEGAALLPVALAGRLPATRRVRLKQLLSESTLFLGAAATSVAVLVAHDSSLWRSLLGAVYLALGGFLGVFAVCRVWFERRVPTLALAGMAVCLATLLVLL